MGGVQSQTIRQDLWNKAQNLISWHKQDEDPLADCIDLVTGFLKIYDPSLLANKQCWIRIEEEGRQAIIQERRQAIIQERREATIEEERQQAMIQG